MTTTTKKITRVSLKDNEPILITTLKKYKSDKQQNIKALQMPLNK